MLIVFCSKFEIKFTAPQKVGMYSYAVMLRSDSYLDFDIFETVKVSVGWMIGSCDEWCHDVLSFSFRAKLDIKPAVQIEDHPQWNIDDDVNESSGQKPQDNADDNDNEYATETDDD